MAEGCIFSLAVPVLNNIYKGLNELIMSPSLGFSKAYFPAHYVYGWLAHYFGTHHSLDPTPPGPCMVVYSGSQGAKAYTDKGARDLIRDWRKVRTNFFILNRNKAELLVDDDKLDVTRFSYMASLRSTFLTLRMSNHFHIEPYNPHRFSRQFGFCQEVPDLLFSDLKKRSASLPEVLIFWRLLLFSGSKSRVLLPSCSITWYENVTSDFAGWWGRRAVQGLKKDDDTPLNRSDKSKKSREHNGANVMFQTHARTPRLKDSNPVVNKHTEDDRGSTDSEVDPKHVRRNKRKADVLDDDDIAFVNEILDGVPSSSRLPSGTLEGDLVMEVRTPVLFNEKLIQEAANLGDEHLSKPRPGEGKGLAALNEMTPVLGRGKEMAMLNKTTMKSDMLGTALREDEDMHSSVGISHASIASPVPAIQTMIPPAWPTKPLACSMISFQPPLLFQGVYADALRKIHSIFLANLKNASFSDVGKVAAQANESYQSIKHLKGDPTPLREKVDSYVGAVNAYLMVEQLAAVRRRGDDTTLQHQKLDQAKLLFDKAREERLIEATEHSTVRQKIVSLETELSKARELENNLSRSLQVRDESLSILEAQVKDAEKTLAELEATPVITDEEEALLQEQRMQLEAMRDSLDIDQ
ncbi:hypothetical protein RND81_06G186000 [Saponaria officinalis]|uniref:Aminotransferase-like plant mobile domain-containing protein n=1 Tax=Saponaria officinalis TaxID=3572 RepID=A0AAW1K7X7_SAPOF